MKILINDANILIDLVKIELINEFSRLSFELYTTDFVLAELNQEQQEIVLATQIKLIKTKEVSDFIGITELLDKSKGLSFEDCSVYYYAIKLEGILITGDSKLRKVASKDGLEVHGIIYILDCLLNQNVISAKVALEKIKLLYRINTRLPKSELTKRIKLWGPQY